MVVCSVVRQSKCESKVNAREEKAGIFRGDTQITLYEWVRGGMQL